MKEIIHTNLAPAAVGPYSQAVRTGGLTFTSGQIPIHPVTGLIPEGITEQAVQALENLRSVLAAAGLTMDDVIKTTVFIRDMTQFAEINRVYATFFTGDYPARSCVEVSALPKGVLIEVEAVACAKTIG